LSERPPLNMLKFPNTQPVSYPAYSKT